ncbi:MAG: hypothetical protein IPP77_14975 [Bacteroidetes bacterium]|nr:hypothetical protein [Bacteroidota bacterium]
MAEISGNNQRAFEGQPLPNPIKVKVTDSKGLAVKGVPVHFELAANHGTATPATVYTDVNGFAQTNWTLGSRLAPVQHMDVSARRGDLSEIISSPIGFTAIIDTPITCTTMIDKDGNSYPGLIIGGRCWDTRNLTSTKYGVSGNPPITQVQDSSAWVLASQLGTEAWCNFQSDPAYGVRNGKLYNWYAVNNANVCPVGWHVPTRTEYQAMFDSLGGNAAASKKIKMNVLYPNNASVPDTGWGLATTQPPLDANNISGFSAASVGSRSEISIYSATDYQDTYFWTSSPVNANTAYAVELKRGISSVTFVTRPKGRGYSVRCIKN